MSISRVYLLRYCGISLLSNVHRCITVLYYSAAGLTASLPFSVLQGGDAQAVMVNVQPQYEVRTLHQVQCL